MKRVDTGSHDNFEGDDLWRDEDFQHLEFREHWPAPDRVSEALQQALARIAAGREHDEEDGADARRVIRVPKWMGQAVAAAVAGVVLIPAVIYFTMHRPAQHQYATAYGTINKIVLPDSSTVVLNGHSSLTYGRWKTGESREVWLDGEAWFDVRQTDHAQPFTVHTKELNIDVLSTAFDIRRRRGQTEVVLESGRIRVTFLNGAHAPVMMAPGDLLNYDPQANTLSHKIIPAADYTAWTNGRLQLPDPSVTQIAQYLEDNFGYKVILKDPSIAKKKIEGPILFDNLDDVLFVLSKVLSVDISKHDSTLIFTPR